MAAGWGPWAGAACAGAGLALYLLYSLWVERSARRMCGRYVTFLPRIPFLGNALMLVNLKTSVDVWGFITDFGNRFPRGVMFWLFHLPWLIVTELDVVEAVLTSSESIEKSHVYRLLDTITDGVFTANGLRWKKLRKKLNLTFSPRQLELLYEDVNDQVPLCVQTLSRNTGKHLNIMSFMIPYFFDIVSRTHFGVETTEQTDRQEQVTETAAKIIELTIENRVFKLHNHFRWVFETSRCCQFVKKFRSGRLDFIRKIISRRIEEAEIEKAKGVEEERKRVYYVDGIRDALVELNIPPTVYNLERNTADMLIAASDTTSVAVSAVFYYLALHPRVQERVFAEVLPIFGERRTMRFTKEDLARMEYTEMVIKETLRHTSPPGIIRELTKDLDIGKYVIPQGTNVYLAIKSIHKNPEYYERADEFYPEHFAAAATASRSKYAFLPFSHGPRNCPGMAYSYVTMKAVISSVVRNFLIETKVALEDIKYKMVLMTEHKDGYHVKLTRR